MTRPLDNPECCFVCRRRADGLGYSDNPDSNKRIGWMCEDCAHSEIGKAAYAIPTKTFDVYEARALQSAGQAGGEYLDAIGQTDLAELDPHNFTVFCTILIETFGTAIRAQVARGINPQS